MYQDAIPELDERECPDPGNLNIINQPTQNQKIDYKTGIPTQIKNISNFYGKLSLKISILVLNQTILSLYFQLSNNLVYKTLACLALLSVVQNMVTYQIIKIGIDMMRLYMVRIRVTNFKIN